jgi:outer membrane lipoprotein SlyB
MKPTTNFTLAATLAPALLLAGCVTTSTYSREVEPAYAPQPWSREGQIVSIREIVQRTEGQAAAGALTGGLIGGFLGSAITGGDVGGTLFGAIGGAATGAAVSQGSSERRTYEVEVRFDDGTYGRIAYSAPPPWHTGDRVRQTARGLEWVGRGSPPGPPPRTAPPRTPPPSQPPPPPSQPPPPPGQPPLPPGQAEPPEEPPA